MEGLVASNRRILLLPWKAEFLAMERWKALLQAMEEVCCWPWMKASGPGNRHQLQSARAHA
eukprot:1147494-Pelagomonas_calceolata.AAC.3